MEQASGYQGVPAEGAEGVLRVQRPSGTALPPLPGRVLEAVYVDDPDELTFLTHDILHEEQLDICLLRDGELLDRISLGQMFQPADFGNLTQVKPTHFTFTFPADVTWALKVSRSPRFTLPDLRGAVSRLRMWQSYFTLKRSNP
jgi:hypothetical protein